MKRAELGLLAAVALLGEAAAHAQTADQSGARAAGTRAGVDQGVARRDRTPAAKRARNGQGRPTTADTAMNTGATTAPTGPDTTTPDAQGVSDLSGSTGASVPLSAAPAPPTPAPPGGAPSGGYGPGEEGGPH